MESARTVDISRFVTGIQADLLRFAIDDEQQSTVWENEYFAGDDEVRYS